MDYSAHRTLDAASVQWLIGRSGLAMIASSGGEEPDGVAMRDPIEEVVTDLLCGESVRLSVIVISELPDGAEVGVLSALAQTGVLKVLKHPLGENRGHVLVLSQRVKKQPLRTTLVHGADGCQSPAGRWEFP